MARLKDVAAQRRRQRPAAPTAIRLDQVFWAAWLYYEEGLKQDEIASRFGISRATVFNLLHRARSEGVVTITIDPGRMALVGLATEIAEKTGLAECFVIPGAGADEPLCDRIGRFGARLIEQRLGNEDVLGVAWGRTVMSLSKALMPMHLPGASIAQVTGSSIATYDFSPELCTSNIAVRIGGRCINLHAPGIVSTAEVKRLLMQEPVLQQHFKLLRSCTKTLFGVTHLGSETLLKGSGFMSQQILEDYQGRGAIGFLSGYFFDGAGRQVRTGIDDRHIVMPYEDFLRVPERICVGGGLEKIAAIKGMLLGRYANVLVTDETTARALLQIL